MLEFYKEKVELTNMQIVLAKEGYAQKIKSLSDSLKYVNSVEEAEKLIDDVKFAKKAISELEIQRDAYMRDYNNEYEKRGNK